MALSRIWCGKDFSSVLPRFNSGTVKPLDCNNIWQRSEYGKGMKGHGKASLHLSGVRRYPEAPKLPLPSNVSEIFGNETGRFTPERARDIAAPVLIYSTGNRDFQMNRNFDVNSSWGAARASFSDDHVDSYDCFGAVSLNSSMQSNVPLPYCSNGKASHFNMPGGQWAKDSKYIAEDMQKSHYTNVKVRELMKKRYPGFLTNNIALTRLMPVHESRVCYSTDSKPAVNDSSAGATKTTNQAPLTKSQKLKSAVKVYGPVTIVFHVGISLISLGACYIAVSSGLDLTSFVTLVTNESSESFKNFVTNSSTFVIAYAIHKALAPIRIAITLGSIPFVVRYLLKIGILKPRKV